MINGKLLLFFSCVLFFLTSKGQITPTSDNIDCDRPDQTEGPVVIPAGSFQWEAGFTFEQSSKNTRTIYYPSLLFRAGLKDVAELRIELENTASFVKDEHGINKALGLHPVVVGMKVKICEERKSRPQISILAKMSIPILATPGLTENYPSPSIILAFQNQVQSSVTLSYNAGIQWDGDDLQTTALYSLSCGYDATDRLNIYAELYGFAPIHQKGEFYTDCGLSYFPRHDIMLDFSGGVSIDRKEPYWYIGPGISYRLQQ